MGGETLQCSGCGAGLAPSQLHPKSGDQWEPPHHPPTSLPGIQSLSIPACLPHQPGPLLSSTRGILPFFAGIYFSRSITSQENIFSWKIITGGLQEIRPCWELTCPGGTFSWWWSAISLFLIGLDAENFDFGICVGGRWFRAANCQQMH